MSNIETFGIIGGGAFGPVAAKHLSPQDAEVLVFDKNPDAGHIKNTQRVGFTAVATADVVVLAVPFDAYQSLLPELAETIKPDTMLVDVCSVKTRPSELFQDFGLMDRNNVLMTHPLFGPQSVDGSAEGKKIVVTKQHGSLADELQNVWRQKGIDIVQMSPNEHDQEMAVVHALTFFVGRALLEMDIKESFVNTNYFSKLLSLVELERHHSRELFDTIQCHNPFAAGMREEFLSTLKKLHDEVS